MGEDPFSMAIGATTSGLQALGGLIQAIGGNRQAKRAQRDLENLQSPTYTQNQSVLDYYNKALARYNVNPTDSAQYKRAMQGIDRGAATGLSNLQGRRSALAGTSSILRAVNDAKLDAEVAAENEKSNRFGQLGGATEMKAGEDRTAFDINQYQPFERKYNRLAQKAAAGAQIANAGFSNIFGGLQSAGNLAMLKKQGG